MNNQQVELKDVLNFVKWHYLDEKLSIVAKHLYEDKKFDIIWYRDKEVDWTIRDRTSEESARVVNSKDLLDELNKEKIDIVDFQIVLHNKVLLHIAHLNFVVSKGADLFGKASVEGATKDLNTFYADLQEAIEVLLVGKTPKKDEDVVVNKVTKLKLVKDETN
jgi:hypothetical protein